MAVLLALPLIAVLGFAAFVAMLFVARTRLFWLPGACLLGGGLFVLAGLGDLPHGEASGMAGFSAALDLPLGIGLVLVSAVCLASGIYGHARACRAEASEVTPPLPRAIARRPGPDRGSGA